jgi:hypothetical protein
MSRKAREEMMLNLELKSSMEPVHPFRAVNVHGSFQLFMEPFIIFNSMSVG